jgi:hypothetical protein
MSEQGERTVRSNLDSLFLWGYFPGYILLGVERRAILAGDFFLCGFNKEKVGELVG